MAHGAGSGSGVLSTSGTNSMIWWSGSSALTGVSPFIAFCSRPRNAEVMDLLDRATALLRDSDRSVSERGLFATLSKFANASLRDDWPGVTGTSTSDSSSSF